MSERAKDWEILNERELAHLENSPGDDCDMAAVKCVVRELRDRRAQLAKLQLAAPVMLTVMALLSDEADLAGLRESALWFYGMDPDHLETWLDAEHARASREKAKEERRG